jgi:hypothetical protein
LKITKNKKMDEFEEIKTIDFKKIKKNTKK